MTLFTSSKEKRYWLFALMVVLVILSSLIFGSPFIGLLKNQDIQAVLFLLGMLLTGITILIHGLNVQPSKAELAIWMGIAAVYLMVFLRLGLAERSHLIEYSVLAVFIHKALIERLAQDKPSWIPASIAFGLTFLIGIIDECVQIFLPERVFDLEDIVFNGMAAFMAILGTLFIQWIRKKFSKN